MAALARSIAAAKEKEEREREEEKRKDETLQKKLQALRDRKFPEPRAAGAEANTLCIASRAAEGPRVGGGGVSSTLPSTRFLRVFASSSACSRVSAA